MEDHQTLAVPSTTPAAAISRRNLLRIGAIAGCGALFALTACAFGGGGNDEDDEDDDDDD